MKNNFMSFAMVAMIIGLFGWAGYEYAKAGYETWKERHHAPRTSELLEKEEEKVP